MNDVQTQSILEKSKIFQAIISEDLAVKVLEINNDAESSRNSTVLKRLIASLDQYVSKEKNLMYIGLVGHYSSGKSSTINSILNLSGTKEQRETGLNPTDKAITLITHQKNSSFLILMNREGGSVPIRSLFMDNDLLENIVLSDTPGSGDPEVINEMIQDFLPICDLIFYFISSANPIDQADLPLLYQKADKLPFIPLNFVITRTDEFRIDKTKAVSKENIDNVKQNDFLGKLIARIKPVIKSDNLNTDSFIFIDNDYNYNIPQLQDRILHSAIKLDQQSLIEMHGHKVEYFRASLNSIYSFFVTAIDNKINQSRGFVKTANENITRFDKSVELNNEKLRLLWAKSETILKESFNEEKNLLSEIRSTNLPINLTSDKLIASDRKLIAQYLDSQANGYFGKLVLDINAHFKLRIGEIKHNIIQNSNKENLLKEDLTHLFLGRLDFDIPSYSVEVDFTRINDMLTTLSQKSVSVLNETKNLLRQRIAQIKSHSAREVMISRLLQVYDTGKVSIFDNFDQYFEKIHMYRSTVLTKNTKETIQKLRIGTQLDELNDEFEDDYVSSMKNKAVDVVYVKNDLDISTLRTQIESYHSKLTDIKTDLEKIVINRPEIFNELLKENVDVSSLMNDLIRQKEEFVNEIYQTELAKVVEQHRIKYRRHLDDIRLAKEHRRKSIIKWSIIVAGIFLLGYLALRFFNIASPTTTTGDILIGLVTTAIGSFLGAVPSMLKSDIKKVVVASEEQFKKTAQSEIVRAFGESFWNDLSRSMAEAKSATTATILNLRMNQKIEPLINEMLSKNQKILIEHLAIFERMRALLAEYEGRIQNFYNRYTQVFVDADKNLSAIGEITKAIKEFSIKPSFELLEETTSNLEKVKLKILSIKNN